MPKTKKFKYEILTDNSSVGLEKMVNAVLDGGGQLVGGVSYAIVQDWEECYHYAQAVLVPDRS